MVRKKPYGKIQTTDAGKKFLVLHSTLTLGLPCKSYQRFEKGGSLFPTTAQSPLAIWIILHKMNEKNNKYGKYYQKYY